MQRLDRRGVLLAIGDIFVFLWIVVVVVELAGGAQATGKSARRLAALLQMKHFLQPA